MHQDIKDNIALIKNRIRKACAEHGRHPDEVRLLLATKTVPAARIITAMEQGCILIAENKIQELKEKYDALKDIPHTNHFIGHLQSNKIKELLRYDVLCVHAIDRLPLAQKLHHRLQAEHKSMDILVQVNTSFEDSKFGVAPAHAIDLIKSIAQLDTLRIKGLMTIGILSAEPKKVQACFRLLKNLQAEIKQLAIPHVEMKELSMGMSADLEMAIAEGATIIRVGTAVFGQRPTSDSYYWDEHKT